MTGNESAALLNKKWGCGGCGFENFGWRATCRECDIGAPAKWKKTQESSQRQPKQQLARDVKGKWANGPPRGAASNQENRALKQELEKVKAQLKELLPPKSETDENAFSKQQVQELETLVGQLKGLGLP